MIRRLDPTAAAYKVLEPNDVLLSFDGVPIANDGTVPFRSGERIGFSYLVSQKYVDEEATLKVFRQQKEQTVKVKLQASGMWGRRGGAEGAKSRCIRRGEGSKPSR